MAILFQPSGRCCPDTKQPFVSTTVAVLFLCLLLPSSTPRLQFHGASGAMLSYFSFDNLEGPDATSVADMVHTSSHTLKLTGTATFSANGGHQGTPALKPTNGVGVGYGLIDDGSKSSSTGRCISDPYNFAQSFTWFARVKTTYPNTRIPILARFDGATWAQGGKVIFIGTGGKLEWDTGWVSNPKTTFVVGDNNWHSIAATYESSSTTLKMYVDSFMNVASFTHNVGQFGEPSRVFQMNVGNCATNFAPGIFPGLIDDVAFFDEALSPGQINTLFTNGPTHFLPATPAPAAPVTPSPPIVVVPAVPAGPTLPTAPPAPEIPQGMIVMRESGGCQTDWAHATDLDGYIAAGITPGHALIGVTKGGSPLTDQEYRTHSHTSRAETCGQSSGISGSGSGQSEPRSNTAGSGTTGSTAHGISMAQVQHCYLTRKLKGRVPTGTVALFVSSMSTCPAGWTASTDLNGRIPIQKGDGAAQGKNDRASWANANMMHESLHHTHPPKAWTTQSSSGNRGTGGSTVAYLANYMYRAWSDEAENGTPVRVLMACEYTQVHTETTTGLFEGAMFFKKVSGQPCDVNEEQSSEKKEEVYGFNHRLIVGAASGSTVGAHFGGPTSITRYGSGAAHQHTGGWPFAALSHGGSGSSFGNRVAFPNDPAEIGYKLPVTAMMVCKVTDLAGTDTKSLSVSMQPTQSDELTPSGSVSVSMVVTRSATVALTATASLRLTASPTFTASATVAQTASITTAPTTSPSLSASIRSSASATLSTTASLTVSQTLLTTKTATPPPTESPAFTKSWSTTLTASKVATDSISISTSATSSSTVTTSDSHTRSHSVSVDPTQSTTLSSTVTDTISKSASLTPSVSKSVSFIYVTLHATNNTGPVSYESKSFLLGPAGNSSGAKLSLYLRGDVLNTEFRTKRNTSDETPLPGWHLSPLCTGKFDIRHLSESDDNLTIASVVETGPLELIAKSTFELDVILPVFYDFRLKGDVGLTVDLAPECFARRMAAIPFNFTIKRTPAVYIPDKPTEGDVATAFVLASGAGSGTTAAQLARSSMVLGMLECETSDEPLEAMESPTQLGIGASAQAMYVGGALMNHVFLLGIGGIQLCIAAIYSKVKKEPLSKGLHAVRCPSLMAFPVLLLLEPTAMSAMVTALFAEGGYRFIGVFSLIVCVGLPIATYFYVRKHIKKQCEATFHPVWDPDQGCFWTFWFGNGKWRDTFDREDGASFVQMNRLIFQDYTEEWYHFAVIEMAMCVCTGALDGVKLGAGNCGPLIITTVIVFFSFLVLLIITRPFGAPFLFVFAIMMTVLQLIGSIFVAVYAYGGEDLIWTERAESTTKAAYYLIMFRGVYDMLPLVKTLYRMALGIKKVIPGVHRKDVKSAPGSNILIGDDLLLGLDEELLGAADHGKALQEEEMAARDRREAQRGSNDSLDSLLLMDGDCGSPFEDDAAAAAADAELDDFFDEEEEDDEDAELERLLHEADELAAMEAAEEEVEVQRVELLAKLERKKPKSLLGAIFKRVQGMLSDLQTTTDSIKLDLKKKLENAANVISAVLARNNDDQGEHGESEAHEDDDLFEEITGEGDELVFFNDEETLALADALQAVGGVECVVLRQRILRGDAVSNPLLKAEAKALLKKQKSARQLELEALLDNLDDEDSEAPARPPMMPDVSMNRGFATLAALNRSAPVATSASAADVEDTEPQRDEDPQPPQLSASRSFARSARDIVDALDDEEAAAEEEEEEEEEMESEASSASEEDTSISDGADGDDASEVESEDSLGRPSSEGSLGSLAPPSGEDEEDDDDFYPSDGDNEDQEGAASDASAPSQAENPAAVAPASPLYPSTNPSAEAVAANSSMATVVVASSKPSDSTAEDEEDFETATVPDQRTAREREEEFGIVASANHPNSSSSWANHSVEKEDENGGDESDFELVVPKLVSPLTSTIQPPEHSPEIRPAEPTAARPMRLTAAEAADL